MDSYHMPGYGPPLQPVPGGDLTAFHFNSRGDMTPFHLDSRGRITAFPNGFNSNGPVAFPYDSFTGNPLTRVPDARNFHSEQVAYYSSRQGLNSTIASSSIEGTVYRTPRPSPDLAPSLASIFTRHLCPGGPANPQAVERAEGSAISWEEMQERRKAKRGQSMRYESGAHTASEGITREADTTSSAVEERQKAARVKAMLEAHKSMLNDFIAPVAVTEFEDLGKDSSVQHIEREKDVVDPEPSLSEARDRIDPQRAEELSHQVWRGEHGKLKGLAALVYGEYGERYSEYHTQESPESKTSNTKNSWWRRRKSI